MNPYESGIFEAKSIMGAGYNPNKITPTRPMTITVARFETSVVEEVVYDSNLFIQLEHIGCLIS